MAVVNLTVTLVRCDATRTITTHRPAKLDSIRLGLLSSNSSSSFHMEVTV